MKKIIIILLLLTGHVLSQTTLTSSNNPSPGDIDGTVSCDTTGITHGSTGSNQIWNFNNLTFQDSDTITFVTAGSTPYSSQFPGSNLASTIDNENFSYMTSSPDNLTINGFGGPDLIINNSDPQLYLQYPFTYNSSFSDVFAAEYTASGVQNFRTGTSVVNCDAWGTVNLPGASYTNAIRVHYNIVTRDSSNPGIPFLVESTVNSYVWFVPGKKFPVFEIIYTSITINGTVLSTGKLVDFNQINAQTGIKNISAEIPEDFNLSQNYPNPFNPSTNFEFGIPKSGFVTLKIYDMTGREISTLVNENLSPGKYSYNFNAAGLTSGVYFYTITANGFNDTKKMILLK